jgi:hypothetical protein
MPRASWEEQIALQHFRYGSRNRRAARRFARYMAASPFTPDSWRRAWKRMARNG